MCHCKVHVIVLKCSSDSKGHSHHHGHHHHGLDGSLKLHGLFIVIALSLHEILEGMAIGLQNDTTGVIQLCTAVAAHKFVISFCVGLELSTNGVKLLVHTIYIFTFSLVTPIGKLMVFFCDMSDDCLL